MAPQHAQPRAEAAEKHGAEERRWRSGETLGGHAPLDEGLVRQVLVERAQINPHVLRQEEAKLQLGGLCGAGARGGVVRRPDGRRVLREAARTTAAATARANIVTRQFGLTKTARAQPAPNHFIPEPDLAPFPSVMPQRAPWLDCTTQSVQTRPTPTPPTSTRG